MLKNDHLDIRSLGLDLQLLLEVLGLGSFGLEFLEKVLPSLERKSRAFLSNKGALLK